MSLHRRGDLPFRFGRLLRRRTYPQEALKGLYEYSPLARASAARGAREFLRVLAAWLVWPSLRASMLGPPMCALAMSVDKSEGSSESSISERTLAAVEIAMRVQNDHPQFWASAFLTHLAICFVCSLVNCATLVSVRPHVFQHLSCSVLVLHPLNLTQGGDLLMLRSDVTGRCKTLMLRSDVTGRCKMLLDALSSNEKSMRKMVPDPLKMIIDANVASCQQQTKFERELVHKMVQITCTTSCFSSIDVTMAFMQADGGELLYCSVPAGYVK